MASSNISTEDFKFMEMKSKLIIRIEMKKNEGEVIWMKRTIPEYHILNSLVDEVLKVYEKQKIYLSATTLRKRLQQNVRTREAFRKIDDDFVQLRAALRQFSAKANRSQECFIRFFDSFGPMFSSLRKVRDDLDGAEALDALQKIEIPNLNGLDDMEDAEVNLRVDEWRKLDLSRKYGDILAAMECLCQYI